VERKEGMFDEIFNIQGSLYTLSGTNFEAGKTSWSAEVISNYEEYVLEEEHIDNVLDKLNELAKNGELQLYRFPNRPAFVPADNSDLIPKVIDCHNKGFKNVIDTFLQIYPELEDKLNKLLQNNN
jgi:Monomeric isocitrate dehydrogenase